MSLTQLDSKLVSRFASTLMRQTSDGVMLLNPDGRIILANDMCGKIIGCDTERMKGLSIHQIVPGNLPKTSVIRAIAEIQHLGEWEGQIRAQWPGQEESIHCLSRVLCTRITGEIGEPGFWTLLQLQDRRDIEEASKLAVTDPLTGLPNRRLFEDRLKNAVAHANRYGGTIGVFFLDLDLFKRINDTIGHHAGDEVLKEIGRRLSRAVRESDSVARIGGDEFTIIATEIGAPDQAARLAKRLIDAVVQPIFFEDNKLVISTSVGMALYPLHGTNTEDLLSNADLAMYEAKSGGRNDYRIFDETLRQRNFEELGLEQRLRQAIDAKEIALAFQPVVDLRDGTWTSVEALLRWKDPHLQAADTGWLIQIAERFGMIKGLGVSIIECAAEIWKTWPFRVPMSLNLSPDQVDDLLVTHLREIMHRNKIAKGDLCIEIHEAGLFNDDGQNLLASIKDISSAGIQLAVDDFGSAQSSLRALRDLPVDTIKLDAHFIEDLHQNEPGQQIVKAVLAMADALKIDVIVEGVETEDQIQQLLSLGCRLAQGYALARPMSAEDVRHQWPKHQPVLSRV